MNELLSEMASLSPERRALLARLLKANGSRAISDEEDAPLSFAQEQLWFLHELDPDDPSYNIAATVHFRGMLDVTALEQALRALVARHETLRTTLVARDGRPVQHVAPALALGLPLSDLRSASEAEVRAEVLAEARRPFDLEHGPLLRLALLKFGEDEHALLIVLHHSVGDGWSMRILVRELALFYDAFVTGQDASLGELPLRYRDHAAAQRLAKQGEAFQRDLAYWKTQLAGAPAALDLPTDRPRPAVRTVSGARLPFRFDDRVVNALRSLNQREGCTAFMVLLASLDVVLHRYTGQDDLCVGTPIAGRNRAETEGLVGLFVNTLVLRCDLAGDPTFTQLLARVRDACLGAYGHQDLPFERVVQELHPDRDLSRSPLFQVLISYDLEPDSQRELPGLTATFAEVDTETAKFDLSVYVREHAQGLGGFLEFNTDLFDRATIERFLGHWQTTLEAALEDPSLRLSELPLLTADEHRVLRAWNDTDAPLPDETCLHTLFESQVARTPNAEALVYRDERLTYSELNQRANRLAQHLRSLGAGPETLVGVCLDRTPDLIVTLLAILKAGAAYVPLDPAYPAERLAFMLDDAGVGLVVSRTPLANRVPATNAPRVLLDADAETIARADDRNPASGAGGDNLAYVLYTSGSTGRPKGVAIEHRGVVSLVAWAHRVLGLEALAGVLASTSIAFDISVIELYVPLSCGGRIILVENALATLPAEPPITLINTVPSAMSALSHVGGVPATARTVILAGEPVSEALVRDVHALGTVDRVFDMYGPTETTVYSTASLVPRRAVPTIGRPIANTRVYVLDAQQKLVPVGVPGELFIGGIGLARGYLNRPELTAEKFVLDPFGEEPRGRLYRTGDLVRWLAGGELEFLGRLDHQVKIRGFRIELGEIEAVLRSHSSVGQAVVVAREDAVGDKRLVAYVTPAGALVPSAEDLARHLRAQLPEHMVPSSFVLLDALPLTANGKVDRKALPTPQTETADGQHDALSPLEAAVVHVWEQLLPVKSIGPQSQFFDLGGHSLLATRVAARLRDVFRVDVPVRALFEAPTVAALARWIENAQAGGLSHRAEPIVPADRQACLPLSFAQQRLWFLDQWQPNSALYNIPAAVRLIGLLDVDALERALGVIVQRHEVLRTTFPVEHGQPTQVIASATPFSLPVVDLSTFPTGAREAEAQRLAEAEAHCPFDLASGPLVRARLLRLGDAEHLAVVVMHHIIADGWSLGVFFDELTTLYRDFTEGRASSLTPLPVQYADYAAWQRQWFAGDVLDRQLTYWKDRLAGAPDALDLPTDHPRPPVPSYRGASVRFELPDGQAVRDLARREGSTPFMVLLAAFNAVLQRYTGQDDLCVGTPVAGRTRPETEGLIGLFVNTLVLRTDLAGDPTFAELVGRVRDVCLGAYAHQDLPFERLVEELRPQRDSSRSPLFQVMFVLDHELRRTTEPTDLVMNAARIDTGTSKFDLALHLTESSDGFEGWLEYSTELFEPATASRLVGHLGTLLDTALSAPQQRLSTLPMLTEAEQQQIEGWNSTLVDYPQTPLLHQLFEQQVANTPNAEAVRYENHALSYQEVNARAEHLAAVLQQLGVGPDKPVAVAMERSLELVIALLGILKAGGAYVPLDPDYPRDRLDFMLQDAGTDVLLTQSHLRDRLPSHQGQVLCLDTGWGSTCGHAFNENPSSGWIEASRESVTSPSPCATETLAPSPLVGEGWGGGIASPSAVRTPHPNPPPQGGRETEAFDTGAAKPFNPPALNPEHLAYVIYTSGSTGRPKGAQNSHRAISNRLLWMQDAYRLTPDDTVLQKTPYSFDVSVWEFFWPLITGARLVLARPGGHKDPGYLADLIEAEHVSVCHFVPSMLEAFLTEPALDRRCVSLRDVMCSGEALSYELQERFFERVGARLHNLYGPTEAAVDVTYWECRRDDPRRVVPIGRPIANIHMHVLDGAGRETPVGVPGELHIGGVGLARGYHNRPELTAEKFIHHGQLGRLYRTGDLGRWLADGSLEYLGRLDHQVKLRGFRVELGEIEAVLCEQPGVRASVVLAREDVPGDKRLVAYVVLDAEVPTEGLRTALRTRLPEYMVPSSIVVLESLPLSPNGKVDRKVLPAPESAVSAASYVAPRDAVEEAVAAVWSEVLGVERVGAHDNFFDLGGHSLLATRVVSRLRDIFQIDVSLRALFECPTVSGLARQVAQQRATSERNQVPPLLPLPREDTLPISFAQQRLWFLDQWEPESPQYNIAAAVHLAGPLNLVALEKSLYATVQRHEALRTTFVGTDGKPVATINRETSFCFETIDLRTLPVGVRDIEAKRLASTEAREPFDLSHGPLLRLSVLQLSGEEHLVVVVMHHIVADGWSIGILNRELGAFYAEFVADRTPVLPPLPVQYADYAAWQRQWLAGDVLDRQLAYWSERLAGAPDALDLPTDHPRPPVPTYQGASVRFELPDGQAVRDLARREGCTPFMVLLAAFNAVLQRYTGQDDLCIGTPVAGRTRPETEGLIGLFVNTLVLRTDLSGDPTFAELLGRVRDVCLGAYAHQDLPFERLVEELRPQRDSSRSPLFQVMFVLQNAPTDVLELPGLEASQSDVETGTSKFDLTLRLTEAGGRWTGELEYSSELFEPASASRLVGHFRTLLDAALSAPQQRLSTLPMLTEAEQQQIEGWNSTLVDYLQTPLLHRLFEQQVANTPNAEAVRYENHALSYQEVNARAEHLAAVLQQLGVGPDTPVAVAMERSLELVVALLGILKAGGAYVPLDPDYPRDRLDFMLQDAGTDVLLTQSHLRDRLPSHQGQVLCLDTGWDATPDQPFTPPALNPEHLAYVIYTSGSTGRPKGAQNSHRAISNRLLWMQDAYRLTPDDTVLQKTPYSFDVSVWEFFWPLITGARLVLARPGGHKDPGYLADLIEAERVSVCHFVPSMLEAFLTEPTLDRRCASLRDVMCSGEALSYELQERFFERVGARLHNLYGPTEAAVDVTYWECRRNDPRRVVPIGRPIANIHMHVLDGAGRETPVGVPGELHIGGVGLARGYHNRPELTAEKFIHHDQLGRLYRTGDLGRWLADGSLEYLGRLDHQVKLRGFRVELGEIEAVLCEQPGVRASVVLAREDVPGDRRLVAYVVLDAEVPTEGLRTALRTRLPEYMVPSSIVVLEALPLSPNGKVDRKVLPAPESAVSAASYVAPRDAVEEAVAAVWSEVLGVERVGAHDNFFDLGGHSLLATQVLSRLRQIYAVDIPLRRLFEEPTVATLALAIKEAQEEPASGQIAGAGQDAGDAILSQIDALSDDDVDSLLREALASEEV